jgi:hypothetical protein
MRLVIPAVLFEAIMNASQVRVPGTLRADGTLELSDIPKLPPGPVEVLIRLQTPVNGDMETWWEYLKRSHTEAITQGQKIRSKEEIDADRACQRTGDEARRQALREAQAAPE